MKTYETLGQSLGREEQKKITGGALPPFSDLICRVTASGPDILVDTYATNAICRNEGRPLYCTGTGVPYEMCKCTPDTIWLYCDN